MERELERRWKWCQHGHVLGEIVRVEVSRANGKRRFATRLRLFRHAVSGPIADTGDVVAVLEGTAPELDCDLCHPGAAPARWEIGAEALEYLLQLREQRSVVHAPMDRLPILRREVIES